MTMLRGRALTLGAAAALLATAAVAETAPSGGATHAAGTWDLSFEKGNRRCRLFLRAEPRGADFALAMPAGCHKAFPTLATATSWAPGEGERIDLKTDAGTPVMSFAPGGEAGLVAAVGEGGDTYLLTPINPALQAELRAAAAPAAAEPGAAAAAPDAADAGVLVDTGAVPHPAKAAGKAAHAPAVTLPATTVGAVAGNYAVLRQNRDTGCMVTLEAGARARLAPACRDQGIVIFDPTGWQLLRGSELVLKARKGHTTALSRRDEATWANEPAHGAALMLKRL